MTQQSRHDDGDDEDGTNDDFADPASQYFDGLDGLQQHRYNSNEGSGLSDDEHSEEEQDEGSYNPMELDRATNASGAEQSEADWLSYISRLSHMAKLNGMKTAMAYIEALKTASLDDEWSKLDAETLYQL